MKKMLSSRIGQVLVSAVVVIICLAGLAYWAAKKISNNPSIKAYLEFKAAQAAKDANATEAAKPDDLPHVGETEEKEVYKEKKQKQDEDIVDAFAILNATTAPGEMRFNNPKFPVLLSELNDRWSYINKRESELAELEAHVAEQLQSMHWHTNQITRNRIDLSRHFEGRVNLIRKEEQTRLQELAKIYENLLSPDQLEGPAVVRQIMRANLAADPKLNAKVFQYISIPNQAAIIRALLSGADADTELYENIIQNHQKTMAMDAIKPKTNP